MIDAKDAASQYFAPLNEKSQVAMEERNLSDKHTDILLMSTDQFKEMYRTYLRTDIDIKSAPYGNLRDKSGNLHKVQFVTAEEPRITYNMGAYPCSLVMAFDGAGNFGVIHITRYQMFVEDKLRKLDSNKEIKALEALISAQMEEDVRIVVSGTNLESNMQQKIVDSIAQTFSSAYKDTVESLLIDGSRLYDDTEVPPGYISSSKDHIQAVCFIPRAFTTDDKNKVILIGQSGDADNKSALWLIRDFNKELKKGGNGL